MTAELTEEQILASQARRAAEKEKMADGRIRDRLDQMVRQDPGFAARVQKSWRDVEMDIHKRAIAARPKPKDFEVRLETEVGKDAFLIALDETGDPEAAAESTKLRLTSVPEVESAAPGL